MGIPVGAKNRTGAWLYLQWANSKLMFLNWLREGAGTPPRASDSPIKGARRAIGAIKEHGPDAVHCILQGKLDPGDLVVTEAGLVVQPKALPAAQAAAA